MVIDYYPDKWVKVKISSEEEEPLYKIFATWYGGYLGSDQWRLNSGIESVKEEPDYYIFHGYSGSDYYCSKNSEGFSAWGQGIFQELCRSVNIPDKGSYMERVNHQQDS